MKIAVSTACLLLALLGAAPAGAALTLEDEGTYDSPMYATAPRSDATSLYVVERAGKVKIRRAGATLPVPFLDISSAVGQTGAGTEGGLLSLAFATDYSTSGLFYVYMTPNATPPETNGPIQIREYRRSASDPDVADPASGRVVLTIPHPDNPNHYGGGLAFGPDGRLYIGTGDGGGAGDVGGNSQSLESRLGKLLRIDPRASPTSAYRIPADNPFAGEPGDDLIWSYGLRNPFRFSWDRATGYLAIGDVGQYLVEEIDYAPLPSLGRGANFGWNRCEGRTEYSNFAAACPLFSSVPPAISYVHPSPGCSSVTGGVVVRDPGLEDLAGRYIYGDYCRTWIRSAVLDTPDATGDRLESDLAIPAFRLVAFGEDGCGRVYAVFGGAAGGVRRISDGTDAACVTRPEFTPALAPPPPEPPALAVPDPPDAATPVVPTAGPKLVLGGRTSQRVLGDHTLGLRVRCDRPCKVAVAGLLSLPGKDSRLRSVRAPRATGTVTILLPVGKKGRAAIRMALRRGKKPRARLTIQVRGDNGQTTTARRSIRITG